MTCPSWRWGSEPSRLHWRARSRPATRRRRGSRIGTARTPITEIPSHWPAAYRDLVQRRLDLIESDRFIRLLEKPEYKRRWASEPWDKQVERALRGWLLDRLEDRAFWFDPQGRPAPKSVAQLADQVSRDADLVSVLELWSGRKDQSVTTTLGALLADEGVPFLAAYRLKDTGLRKREAWEHTWDLQRREDAGEQVGPIPVPPKYTSADFKKTVVVAAPGQARRAEGAVRPLPGRRPGDRLDARCSAGRVGTTPSRRWRWGRSSASARTRAGRTSGWSRWWRAWPSCNRG